MSIASELNNYRNGLDDAWDAAEDMGATIPHDRNMVNLDDAIRTIPVSSPNDGVLTITQNGVTIQTFSADQATNVTAALTDTIYTAGTGINISAQNVISATASGMTLFNTEQNLRETQFAHAIFKDYARTEPAYTEDLYNAATSGGAILFCDDRGSDESESYYITVYYDPDDSYYEIRATSGTEVYRVAETAYHSGTYTSSYIGFKDFTGATSQHWGASGLVPTPFSSDVDKFLKGDGTWATPTDTTYSDFTGATSSVAGVHGLVPAPTTSDPGKFLKGDGTWGKPDAELVEMYYGESNAWAKFIDAYTRKCIVYCRASSNSNPGSGAKTRKAFMAYVNNEDNPTSVEFQYVRSASSKTDSQQTDQVFVYTLTNASGGTWSVASRNMGPKINVSGPITKTFTSGANATITIGADAMTGATSGAAGAAGVVPAPAAGDQNKVLRGDGTWGAPLEAYSTTEQAVGTWTDGKTIYRTVFEKTFSTLATGDNTWAHNISNISEIVGIRTMFNLGWDTDTWGSGDYLSGSGYQVRVDKTNFIVNNTTSATNWFGTIKAVIEYTKS